MFDSPKKTNELEMKNNKKRPPPLSSPTSLSPTPTKTEVDYDDEMNRKEIQMNSSSHDNNIIFVSTKSNGEKVNDLEAKANAILAKETNAAREARRKRRKIANDIDGCCGGIGICCADCCAQSGECCVIS